ncbi:MAG: hypothetical protein HOW73_12200 [Polyangiaceae bacterium]|nr:hypothetical protein [Polyangiaceae bacterium]
MRLRSAIVHDWVANDATIGSLTAEDQRTFCEWLIAEEGGPGTVKEGDGFTITVGTVDGCVSDFDALDPGCTATVAQGETCIVQFAADLCAVDLPACAELNACFPE